MFKFKRIAALAIALVMVSSFTMGVGAEEAAEENVAISEVTESTVTEDGAISETEISGGQSINLIEDDGSDYTEIVINTNPRLRTTGTYNTTYDMTGGVYTQNTWNCTAAPTFKVSTYPTYNAMNKNIDADMSIYLQKKGLLGWSEVAEGRVSLQNGGTVTLTGSSSGTYRLYFRNWSGFQSKGDITIKFSY